MKNFQSKRTSINKKTIDSQQFGTHRNNRQYQYSILDQTTFQKNKKIFMQYSQKIKELRLIEYLGKYKTLAEKQQKLKIFIQHFEIMKKALSDMKTSSENYQNLIKGKSNDDQKTNGYDQITFQTKIHKQLKNIEIVWTQIFFEGSLKRLDVILNLLKLQKYKIDMNYDINSWIRSVQSNFKHQSKKRSTCCGCF